MLPEFMTRWAGDAIEGFVTPMPLSAAKLCTKKEACDRSGRVGSRVNQKGSGRLSSWAPIPPPPADLEITYGNLPTNKIGLLVGGEGQTVVHIMNEHNSLLYSDYHYYVVGMPTM